MTTYKSPILFISTCILLFASGCSNDIQNTNEATLKLTSQSVDLPTIVPENLNKGIVPKVGIEISNTGKEPLKIKSAVFKNIEAGQFDFDPPAPTTLQASKSSSVSFVIHTNTFDLKCPVAAPNDVPDQFKAKYCGEIVVTSDSSRDSNPGVKGGIGRIFLQYNGGKGHGTPIPASVGFNYPVANSQYTKKIKIINTGANPLQVTSASFNNTINDTLNIPDNFPIEIPPKGEKSIIVTYSPVNSNDTTVQKSVLTLETSAQPKNITIDVNITRNKARFPRLKVSTPSLTFTDRTPQTITITNNGNGKSAFAALSFSFKPILKTEFTNHYSLVDEASNKIELTTLQTVSIPNSKKAFTITPDSTTDTPSVILNIEPKFQHNLNGALEYNYLHLITPIPVIIYGVGTPSSDLSYIQHYPSNIDLPPLHSGKTPIVFYNRGDAQASFNVASTIPQIDIVQEDGTPFSGGLIPANSFVVIYAERSKSGDPTTPPTLEFQQSGSLDKFITSTSKDFNDPYRIDNPVVVDLKKYSTDSDAYELETEPQTSQINVNQFYLIQLKDKSSTGNNVSCQILLTKRPDASKLFFFHSASGSGCYERYNFIPDVEGDYEFSFFVKNRSNTTAAPLELKHSITAINP